MAQVGDDCYFYYYSSCSKGAGCPFRHVEAALGCEVMCTHWHAGNCTRPGCKFRHFEIKVDRTSIPCYWESQPSGCTKAHCAFKHFKQQDKAGALSTTEEVATRVSKSTVFKPGSVDTEKTTLRTTAQQDVDRASPKIEPVVVNPFEDDSDADSASGTPQKKTLVVRKAVPVPATTVVPKTRSSPITVTRKLTAAAEGRKKQPSSLTTSKRRIKMFDNMELEEKVDAQVSVSDSVLFEETRRNVVMDEDGDSNSGKSFQDLLKKSKSSHSLSVQAAPKIQTAKVNVKERLGRTGAKPDHTSPVKVSVKDRLGGQESSQDKSLVRGDVRGDVKSRLGVTSLQSSLVQKSLEDLRAQKLQIKKQLEADSDEESNDSEELDIKIKSLEEIQAEKARKAQLQEKKDTNQEKRGWRKSVKPVLPPAKPAPKRKVITYTELFEEPEKESALSSEPAVEVRSLADIRMERARKKPVVAKKERQIYMPPALKNSDETRKKDITKVVPVKRTITPPPRDSEDNKVAKVNPPADVKVKTFSEIMAEKRRKQQELKAQQEADKKVAKSRPKVSITPIVFHVDDKDEQQEQNTQFSQNGKKTASVIPLTKKNLKSKENVSVENSPDEQRSPGDSRLSEGHILSDNNVCENVKGIERAISREEVHSPAKRLPAGSESEKTEVVSPVKRRSSSQGSDLPTKKKSRQSLSMTEDDDDFFFGTDMDDFEDDGKIDEGDLLQDIDELLA